jgi:hypothetical protein
MALKPPLIGLLALALLGCTPATTPAPDGAQLAAPAPETTPPRAVEASPNAPPEAHPLAPESVPNKPQSIPEEMPGTRPPRP